MTVLAVSGARGEGTPGKGGLVIHQFNKDSRACCEQGTVSVDASEESGNIRERLQGVAAKTVLVNPGWISGRPSGVPL